MKTLKWYERRQDCVPDIRYHIVEPLERTLSQFQNMSASRQALTCYSLLFQLSFSFLLLPQFSSHPRIDNRSVNFPDKKRWMLYRSSSRRLGFASYGDTEHLGSQFLEWNLESQHSHTHDEERMAAQDLRSWQPYPEHPSSNGEELFAADELQRKIMLLKYGQRGLGSIGTA